MADIPFIPDKKNLDTFQDFVNLQKDLNALLMANKNIYADIGRYNESIEKRVTARRSQELKLINVNEKLLIFYQKQKILAKGLEGAAAEHAQKRLDSIKNRIDLNEKEMKMMRAANQLEIDTAQKQHAEDMKWFKFAGQQGNNLFGIKMKEFQLTKSIGDEMIKLGVTSETIAYGVGFLFTMLAGTYKLFLAFDKAAWDFRKAMGMTRAEAAVIRKSAERMAIDFGHIGVTTKEAYDAFQALGETMGGTRMVSEAMAKDVAVMSAQFGIAAKDSVGFMQNLAAVSKSTMQTQVDSMYIAQNMASAAGVGLNTVMQDVAKATGPAVMMLSRVPSIAIKSAIELRRMGTSLKDAAGSSRHILDFTESINEEMEASVLIGQNLNLQKARELAYAGDIVASQQEMVKRARQIGFESKDIFQKEAVAKAMGMSVEQLLKMLQTERQIEQVRLRGSAEERAALKTYEDMRAANEATLKAKAKDKELAMLQLANQERLTAITNKWNQMWAKIQGPMLDVVDGLMSAVIPMISLVEKTMQFAAWVTKVGVAMMTVGGIVWAIVKPFQMIFGWGTKILSFMGGVMTFGKGLTKLFGTLGGHIAKLGFLGKFLGVFVKILGPIGWVITAFQAIGGFIKGWRSAEGGFFSKLLGGIVGALKAIIPGFGLITKLLGGIWKGIKWVGQAVWGVIKQIPEFLWWAIKKMAGMWWSYAKSLLGVYKWIGKMAWEGVKAYFNMWKNIGKWVFNMAKDLGNMIWKGLMSVKDKIVDVVKHPFKTAWGGIKKLWGGKSPSELGLSIVKGISSVGNLMQKALGDPFGRALMWIMKQIPGVGKMVDRLHSGYNSFRSSVEKRVSAAYVPAVTVTPTGTKLATTPKPVGTADAGKEKAQTLMTEETGRKMVSLLEKILAKEGNVKMDGQILSTHLARNTEFHGGFGTNKVA